MNKDFLFIYLLILIDLIVIDKLNESKFLRDS